MKKTTVILVIAIAAVVVAGVLVSKYGSQDTAGGSVLRVGYKPNSGYQNFFVAQENGYFEKHGISVKGVPFESTNQMVQALVNGDIDATPGSSIEVLALTEQHSPDLFNSYLTLVFEQDNAFHSLLVPKDSTIDSLAKLEGKKIGTMPGSTSQSWLEIILGRFFDPKTGVQILQLSPRLQLQALSAGQVDALYTADPITTIGEVRGITRVLMKGPENHYMFTPMATGAGVVSRKFTERDPEGAKSFVAAMYEAVQFMRLNDAETRQIVAEYTGLDAEVAIEMDLLRYWTLGETKYDVVQKYLDLLLETGVLEKPVRAEALYLDASFVE